MGKKKKKKRVKVGSDYYMSLHMVLCQGAIDKLPLAYVEEDETEFIKNLRLDSYSGYSTVTLNKPYLFGKDSKTSAGGGGLHGGKATINLGTRSNIFRQEDVVNPYSNYAAIDELPDFKGVTSYLSSSYVSRSPYLSPYSFIVQRINSTTSGYPQWEESTASLGTHVWDTLPISICFALDLSGSMSGSRLTTMKAAMVKVLNAIKGYATSAPVNIAICGWSSAIDAQMTKMNATTEDINSLIAFVNGLNIRNATYFNYATSFAMQFFNKKETKQMGAANMFVFITDGEPTGTSHFTAQTHMRILRYSGNLREAPIASLGVNIELTNTEYTEMVTGPPVPVIWSGQEQLFSDIIVSFMEDAINTSHDMNPSHIIRECLTDNQWGMGLSASMIDDASFLAAADTLRNEDFGLSFYWNEQGAILDFINNVLAHINGVIVEDKTEGVIKLKLIRDDYDRNTVLRLNETNVVSVTNMVSPSSEFLPAQIILTYQDLKRGASATAVAYNPALFMTHPGAPVHKVDYDGITRSDLAYKIAERDLRVVSTPLLQCDIEATTVAKSVQKGDVIHLTWPRFNIHGTYMRVTAADYGDGRNNVVRLTCIEDVFATPEAPIAVEEDRGWNPPPQDIQEPKDVIVYELGYAEIFELYGEGELERLETEMETLISVFAIRGNPSQSGFVPLRVLGHTDDIDLEDMPEWSDEQLEEWLEQNSNTNEDLEERLVDDIWFYSENVYLTQDLSIDSTNLSTNAVIPAEYNDSILLVDGELIYWDQGQATRGVFDTVPKAHPAGTKIYYLDDIQVLEDEEFSLVEELEVRLELHTATRVELSPETNTITTVGRYLLPYPPACVKLNGVITNFTTKRPDFVITWEDRNRLFKTDGDPVSWLEEGSVTLEPGVDYLITLSGGQLSDVIIYEGDNQTVPFDIRDHETYIPLNPKITIRSRRDGLYCWQPVVIDLDLDYDVDYNWDDVVSLVHFNSMGLDTKGLTWTYSGNNSVSGGKFGRCISLGLSHWSAENLPPEIRFDDDFTVEFWHYPTSVEEENSVLFSALSNDGVPIITIMEEGKRYKIRIGGDYGFGAHFLSDETLVMGRWKAVALSVRFGRMYLFSDGIKVLDIPLPDALPIVYSKLTYGLENDIDVLDENGVPITLKNSKAFIDEARITCGIGRYVADYTPRDKAWGDEKWSFYY